MNLAHTLFAPLRHWWHGREARRARQALKTRCPLAYTAAEALPPAVRTAWLTHGPQEFPGLRTDAFAWVMASTALAQFFEVCLLQGDGQPCGLPSRAADAIWHAALAHARPEFEAWQRRHFGRPLPHRENEVLGAPPDEALARTWVLACRSEGRDPSTAGMPLVFAVDGRLRMPGGWAYSYDFKAHGVQHQLIDAHGRLAPVARFHEAMTLPGLMALGALTAAEIAQMQEARAAWLRGEPRPPRKDDPNASSGSSCGGGCGASWGSSDGGGGSCDGGSGGDGGGSSCGSSCGGGCGGGD